MVAIAATSMDQIISALGEGNAEHDLNFDEVFIPTKDYRRVARMSPTLILGGRGAGKSAIFRRMLDHPEPAAGDQLLTVPLAADRTSWPALEQAAKASNNDANLLSRQWELTLLLLAFNRLVEVQRKAKRKALIRDLDAEVDKVLERTELTLTSEGMLTEVFEAAATILKKLPFTFKVSAPFVPISVEVKDTEDPERPVGREEKVQTIVVEGMYGVLDSLLDAPLTVQILADQLDDFWKATPQQVASLCALISAVMRMKSVLLQRRMDRRLRFSVFLRSDIYEVLKRRGLDDASKYRRHELHLKWDRDALEGMIERRLEVAHVDGVRTLDDLFAEGRLERRPLIEYFFWRVVPRPRDVIQLLAFSLDRAYELGEPAITRQALAAASADYSGWRRDVILEETRYGGDLRAPEAVLDSMSSGPTTYTHQELERRLNTAKRDYGLQETKPQITAALVDWGVLGVQRSSRDTSFIWDVSEGKRPTVNKAAEPPEIYIVHPSLWSALDLRDSPKQKAQAEQGA